MSESRIFDPQFLDALEACINEKWTGTVWRQVFEGTDALRPNARGARWNPPGVEALYTSLDATGAASEIDHLIAQQPIPIRAKRITHRLMVSLTLVVDLRDLAPVADYGVSDAAMADSDPWICRYVGAAVAWLGCGGLLVPGARHPSANLVIFVNNLAPDDSVDIESRETYAPPEG